ncbi:hypothetical protein K469DRAFT_750511 [Zopfia rhizophila CBS 207.26]|uniref:Uncharacterized protein n=1 Tax=Zopfia rhizophila CBS 207.26 TaxID=1314779 RepID=A0A6A6DZ73_9PEZI|nr:hypothetical protein K469DRAFT_750511 [Zopfia rhizophila CBS 207.26]
MVNSINSQQHSVINPSPGYGSYSEPALSPVSWRLAGPFRRLHGQTPPAPQLYGYPPTRPPQPSPGYQQPIVYPPQQPLQPYCYQAQQPPQPQPQQYPLPQPPSQPQQYPPPPPTPPAPQPQNHPTIRWTVADPHTSAATPQLISILNHIFDELDRRYKPQNSGFCEATVVDVQRHRARAGAGASVAATSTRVTGWCGRREDRALHTEECAGGSNGLHPGGVPADVAAAAGLPDMALFDSTVPAALAARAKEVDEGAEKRAVEEVTAGVAPTIMSQIGTGGGGWGGVNANMEMYKRLQSNADNISFGVGEKWNASNWVEF